MPSKRLRYRCYSVPSFGTLWSLARQKILTLPNGLLAFSIPCPFFPVPTLMIDTHADVHAILFPRIRCDPQYVEKILKAFASNRGLHGLRHLFSWKHRIIKTGSIAAAAACPPTDRGCTAPTLRLPDSGLPLLRQTDSGLPLLRPPDGVTPEPR